jgi:ribonuclease P protein component
LDLMQRLRKRQDFLRVRDGRKAGATTLTLQARFNPDGEAEPRAGFTVSKRCGGSVQRNRIRRRLREALRRMGALHARHQHDYVIVGRPAALSAPFEAILDELSTAFARVHSDRPRGHRSSGRPADEAPR